MPDRQGPPARAPALAGWVGDMRRTAAHIEGTRAAGTAVVGDTVGTVEAALAASGAVAVVGNAVAVAVAAVAG